MPYTPTVGEYNRRLFNYFQVRQYLRQGHSIKRIALILGVSTQAVYAVINAGLPVPRKYTYKKWLASESCKQCEARSVVSGLCVWHYAASIGAIDPETVETERHFLVATPTAKRVKKT